MNYSLRIPRLLAALALALAVGLGAGSLAAQAAPLAQTPTPAEEAPAGEPDVIGYYVSDVLPAASSPGLQIALTLYEDGTAEVVSDYLNDEPPIVEVGTWAQNEDGSVTLTVTGTDEQDYAEPIELTFVLEDDGALAVPGEEGGPFGSEGLRLTPSELLAAEDEGAAEATPEATPEPTPEPVEETAGVEEAAADEAEAGPQLYQSEVLPAASGPGLQITLLLDADGSAQMISDYSNGEPPIVEIGEWVENDDGTVTVTLTDQSDRTYEEPVVYTFEASDGALVLAGAEGGPFGAEGLALAAVELGAEEAGAVTAPAEATPAEALPVADAAGAYISQILPAASAPGLIIMAILYPEGEAMVSSYYLNAEPPIIEIGTWAGSGDSTVTRTVTITATGTLERDYELPTSAEFSLAEDGSLVAANVTLTRLEQAEVSPEDAAAAGTAGEDAAGEDAAGAGAGAIAGEIPEVVATYRAEVTPSAASSSLQITLTLYADNSAEMVSDYQDGGLPFIDIGTWSQEDATLTLTLTGSPEVAYEEPVDLVFEVTDDGSLVGIDYPEEVFGEAGLEFAPLLEDGTTAEGTEEAEAAEGEPAESAATEGTTGRVYQSEVLPAASGPGRQITLALVENGGAIMSTDHMNDEPPVTELGEWSEDPDGSITLVLTEGPQGVYDEPQTLVFAVNEDGSLSAVEYDEAAFGQEGLELAPVALGE